MNGKQIVESTLAKIWLVKVLGNIQLPMLILCFLSIAFAIWLRFSGGLSDAVISISAFGSSMGILAYLMGKYIERARSQIDKVMSEITEAENRKKSASRPVSVSGKVPLAIGFANLVGESEDYAVQEDIRQISYIFQRVVSPPAHSIPSAEILFVYARLDENGAISPEGKSGIRQIVQATNAEIVVVATENSPESIKKAIGLPGPKTANIVFTLSRNEKEFGKFFRSLFEKMRGGKDMLSAWVELAPQMHGGTSTSGPETLLAAEGGKIAFPRSGAQQFAAGATGPNGPAA